MLFNSPFFIFAFLPIVVVVYYILLRWRLVTLARSWLVIGSLFFYGYWNPNYLLLITTSILVNYALGVSLHRSKRGEPARHGLSRKGVLLLGIAFNVGLLAYFKYVDFFISSVNWVAATDFNLLHIMLPLAISFFTFQQIAYLVDCYQVDTKEYDFLNYCLFVTFFPQLIAGPIVHHAEMMPQFANRRNLVVRYNNIACGVLIFCMGLFKKIYIADTCGEWAALGFDSDESLGFFDAWGASLSYTIQLYYDFSGYSDMAIGLGLLFNIRLPQNFNSPYKALDIQDFWRRWHMTLSRWLRDYIYIPLGGNRDGSLRTYNNLFITFLVGGLWHGAGWNFVLWGALHGFAVGLHRLWARMGMRMPAILAWPLTFLFVHCCWVFFRATSMDRAWEILAAMTGANGFYVSANIAERLGLAANWVMPVDASFLYKFQMVNFLLVWLLVAMFARNTLQLAEGKKRFGPVALVFTAFTLLYAWFVAIENRPSEFLYFNF